MLYFSKMAVLTDCQPKYQDNSYEVICHGGEPCSSAWKHPQWYFNKGQYVITSHHGPVTFSPTTKYQHLIITTMWIWSLGHICVILILSVSPLHWQKHVEREVTTPQAIRASSTDFSVHKDLSKLLRVCNAGLGASLTQMENLNATANAPKG